MAILLWLSLARRSRRISTNLARTFVTLDNFYASAEVSYDGWAWSTSAQAQDVIESQFPLAYAGTRLGPGPRWFES